MSDERDHTEEEKFAALLQEEDFQTPASLQQEGQEAERVSRAEYGELSGDAAQYSAEVNPEGVAETLESAQETLQGYELQDESQEVLGQLSPPQQWEIEQSANAREQEPVPLEEANPEYAEWLDQAEATFAQMEQDFEQSLEQWEDIEPLEVEATKEEPGSEVEAAGDSEYQPTAEDWAEYGEYLAEEEAQKQAQYEESPHLLEIESEGQYEEHLEGLTGAELDDVLAFHGEELAATSAEQSYGAEMEAILDQYAEQGDDEPAREQEREEPER